MVISCPSQGKTPFYLPELTSFIYIITEVILNHIKIIIRCLVKPLLLNHLK